MRTLLAAFMVLGSLRAVSQDYTPFTTRVHSLIAFAGTKKLDSVWNQLTSEGLPLVYEDSVAFLYRGKANTVAWVGDFNGWGYHAAQSKQGKAIKGTDIWIMKACFPKDARLDYKIVVDDSHWLLDPFNENHQWSGVGGGSPNSELRMPGWHPDSLTIRRVAAAKHGKVEKDVLLHSAMLGYQIMYSVYTPHDYDKSKSYPVIYVTDGYEYMHERLGNMVTILDNLIHLQKIQPVVAVFIDNREPINRANNRRMVELTINEKYLGFLSEELVPVIEARYTIEKDASRRAVLGTSMGGLSAAYIAFSKPDIFGLAGIQSPAFWFRSEIYTICDNPEKPPVKTFMTTGTIHDTNKEGALKMKSILDKNTCTYEYREVNQGHSWGNWRDLIDDILIYFFPV